MSSLSASSFSGVRQNDYRIQRADCGVVNLEHALKAVDDSYITGKAIIEDVLTDSEGEIILQYNEERTLKACYKDFKKRVGSIIEFEQTSWTHAMAAELEPYRNSPDKHLRHVGLNNDKIDGLQNNSSAAVALALKTALEALSSAQTAGAKLDETNKKLGHLYEETVRQQLNSEMGIPWAKSFRFNTLRDIVEWVGDKIRAGRQQKAHALRDIVRVCVGEFDQYPEPKEDVDWERVFYPIVG